MPDIDTTFRWPTASASGVGSNLSAALLTLAALTGGCAWTVLAGHAWLSLLAGFSRWIVDSVERHGDATQPAAMRELVATRAAEEAPTVAPTKTLLEPSPSSSAPSKLPRQGVWQEPLTYIGGKCTGVFVYAVTLSQRGPRWSAVSLATSSTAPGKYARPGQFVENWEVLGITDDWTGANPVVWLAHGEEVCRASLTGNPARVEAVLRETKLRETRLREEARRRREQRRRRRARRR